MLQTARQTMAGGGGGRCKFRIKGFQLNLSSTRSCRRLDVQDDDMPAATAKAKASEAQA